MKLNKMKLNKVKMNKNEIHRNCDGCKYATSYNCLNSQKCNEQDLYVVSTYMGLVDIVS